METIKPIEIPAGKAVVLFDGVCNICNGFVQFVLPRDHQEKYLFASLQSEVGRVLLEKHGLSTQDLDTVVLVDDDQVFTHSDVGIRMSRDLGGLWPLLYGLRLIPKSLRDGIYNWIAKNRYRWFGKKEACPIPTPAQRRRFLS